MITAGRGPVECGIAVKGIQQKFRAYMNAQNITPRIAHQKLGSIGNAMDTIVFEIDNSDLKRVEPWIGTLKWECKSPIRRFHKRKNWFIKCEKITIPESAKLMEKDVVLQTFRASGPGGQHRNKVETAVRLSHKQTGIIVTASDGKSQHQNRKKAWEKLRSKMKDMKEMAMQQQNLDQWTEQIEVERGNPSLIFVGLKFKYKL